MFLTATSLHLAFLKGIKKEYSGTVTPDEFVALWNEKAQPKWIADCVSMKEGIETTEKKINDLQPLRREYIFNPISTNRFSMPDAMIFDENGAPVEKHMRTLNVSFKIDYDQSTDQQCDLTGISDWLDAKIMRSDQKTYAKKSAFRRPTDSNLYYDVVDGLIRFISDPVYGSPAVKMDMEYLRLPNEIAITGTDVPSILGEYQCQEIIDICVELYLERVKDPRLSQFIQAGMQQPITKL